MHVLMLMTPGVNGGAPTMIRTLLRALERYDVRVTPAIVDTDVISIGGVPLETIWGRGLRQQTRALIKWTESSDIDLIHTHLTTYRLGAWVGWRTKRPSLRTMHGRLTRPGMMSPAEKYSTRIAARLFDQKIIAVSEWVTRDLITLHHFVPGKTIFEIPNGIDVPATIPRRRRPMGDLRVFYAGRLEEAKGFHHVLEAIIKLQHEGTPIRLIAVGEGTLKSQVMIEASTTRQIEIIDKWVPRETVLTYFENVDVFVLPSYSEGLSMTLLEAMARGVVPVVSEAATANGLVVNGVNGFVVKTGSSNAIYAGLRQVLQNPNDWDTLRYNAYTTVRSRFSADLMAAQYADLYGKLCSPPSPSYATGAMSHPDPAHIPDAKS